MQRQQNDDKSQIDLENGGGVLFSAAFKIPIADIAMFTHVQNWKKRVFAFIAHLHLKDQIILNPATPEVSPRQHIIQ